MAYKITEHDGDLAKTRAALPLPMGPNFDVEVIARIDRLEVFGSGIKDPGDDWCEFIAYDESGNEIARKRVAGY